MRLAATPSGTCERAREWISLELDGELSELERGLLRAHVRRCAACSAFAVESRAATRVLRTAALEHPADVLTAPRVPRVSVRGIQAAAAAAAIAVAVGLSSAIGTIGPPVKVTSTARVTLRSPSDDLTEHKLRTIVKSPPAAPGDTHAIAL